MATLLAGAALLGAAQLGLAQTAPLVEISLPPGRLSWSAPSGVKYQVQFSQSLSPAAWSNLGGWIPGNGSTNQFVILPPGLEQQRFFQVVASTNAFKRWPSSDLRLDTAHAYTGVALDSGTFSNVVGMPLLLQLYVNRIEDLQTNSSVGGYDFNRYFGNQLINGVFTDDPYPGHLTPAETAFVQSYYTPFFASPKPSLVPWYSAFRSYLRSANPAQLVGSYVGGGFCVDQPDTDFYPGDVIDSHAVNALGHLGFSNSYMRVTVTNQFELAQWYVQPADTPNITNFQNALLNQAIARNTDFLFLDNINGIAYGYYPPDDVNAFITHISQICGKFNANGYGAVFNIGKLPAWQRDFGPLGTTYEAAFDTALGDNGAYVEQSFRFRDEFDTTQQELASRRTLLHQGALTVLSPSPQGYSVLSCVEWTAALAMIMREPGDSVFVVTDKDINNSGITWKDWPGIYGPPNSAIHFGNVGNTNWFFERTFTYQSGEITAVHIHVPGPSSVNILPVANLVDYHLIPGREPTRGTWDDVAHTYNALADPNLDCDTDDGMSDSFVLGKNPGPPGIYEAIMAVDVLFTRPASCP